MFMATRIYHVPVWVSYAKKTRIDWARPAVNLKPSSIATLPSSQKVLARPRWQQAMTPRDYAACDAVDREPREPLRPF